MARARSKPGKIRRAWRYAVRQARIMRSDVRKIGRGVGKVYRAGKAVGRGLGKAWQGVGKLAVGIQSMSKAIRRKGKQVMARLDQQQRAPHQAKARSDVGAKSMRSLKQTIAAARTGDPHAKAGLAKANEVMLRQQAMTRAKEIREMGVKRDYLILKPAGGK